MDFANSAPRDSTKLLRIHLLLDRYRADQVMRGLYESRGIGFPGQEVEAAINLKCVGADDFCTEIVRDIGRELRFSGGSWTDDKENVFHSLVMSSEVEISLTVNIKRFLDPFGFAQGKTFARNDKKRLGPTKKRYLAWS